jgi:hypothetical protein
MPLVFGSYCAEWSLCNAALTRLMFSSPARNLDPEVVALFNSIQARRKRLLDSER